MKQMDREDREHFKTMNSASAEQSTGKSKAASFSALDLASCQMHAKAICGCYRRDEAQDPETFAAALAIVLQEYPLEIVRFAADPRTGVVTAFPMGLPNIGQIRQFLQDKLVQHDRLQHLASLPKVERRCLPRPVIGPGDLANVLVTKDCPIYPRLVERAKTADAREYRHEANGIRVALGWLDKPTQQARHFKVPTIEDISHLYARQEAPADCGEDMGHGELG